MDVLVGLSYSKVQRKSKSFIFSCFPSQVSG